MSVEAQFAPYCDKVVEYHQYRQLEGLTAAEARTDPDTFTAFCEAAQMVADTPELGMAYRGVLTARGQKRQVAIEKVRSIELSIAAGLFDAEVIGDEAYTRRKAQLQKPAEVIRHAKSFDRLFSAVLPDKPKRSIRRRARAVAVTEPVAPVVELTEEPVFELPPASEEPLIAAVPEMPLSFLPEPEPEEVVVVAETPEESASQPELVLVSSEPEIVEPSVAEEVPLDITPEMTEDEQIAVFASNVLIGIRAIERNGEGVREPYLRQKLQRYLKLDEDELGFLFEDFQETGELRIVRQDRLDGTFWTAYPEADDVPAELAI